MSIMQDSAASETDVIYVERMKQNFHLLKRSIDPTKAFIKQLSFFQILSKENIAVIESQDLDDDKISCLLEILQNQPSSVVERVIEALKDNKQEHVAALLSGETSPDYLPMSEEHYSILRKRLPKLRKFINPSGELLDHLIGMETFEPYDEERVESKKTIDDEASEVIKILLRKPDKAFDEFVDALRETKQMHVVNILTGAGEPPMSEQNLNILRGNKKFLTANIYECGSTLLSSLITKGVLTDHDEQRIKAVKAKDELIKIQNELAKQLIDVLMRKPDSAFKKFIEALVESDHQHVADVLLRIEPVTMKAEPQFNEGLTDEQRDNAQNVVVERLNAPNALRQGLQQNGVRVFSTRGCIAIHLSFDSIEAVDFFENLFKTGEFQKLFNDSFSSLMSELGIKSFNFKIDVSEFDRYRDNLSKSTLMTAVHRKALCYAADNLVGQVRVTYEVLERLKMHELRKLFIKQQSDSGSQAKALFEVLKRQPDEFFGKFISVLKETEQTQVADDIEREAKSVSKEVGEEETTVSRQHLKRHLTEIGDFEELSIDPKVPSLDRTVTELQLLTLPDELQEMVVMKAAKLRIYESIRMPSALLSAKARMFISWLVVCNKWWSLLRSRKSIRRKLRRFLSDASVDFPLELLKAAAFIRKSLASTPMTSKDADKAAIVRLAKVCRHWRYCFETKTHDPQKQIGKRLSRLFRYQPQVLTRLNDVDGESAAAGTPSRRRSEWRLFRRREVVSRSSVRGVAQARGRIFVIYDKTCEIDVFFDDYPYEKTEPIVNYDIKRPSDIVACHVENQHQLFVSEFGGDIWRIELESPTRITKFAKCEGEVQSMSISSSGLVMTSKNRLCVYEIAKAQQIKNIRLPPDLYGLHAVESKSGTYIVSDYSGKVWEVVEEGNKGEVSRISNVHLESGRLNYMTLDRRNRLLVTDKSRVELLSVNLRHDRHLINFENFGEPLRLNYCQEKKKLSVGFDNGKVVVYDWK